MHLQFLPLSFLALAGTSFAVKQVNSQEYSKLPKSEGFIKEDPHDFSEKEIPEFTGPYPKDAWVEYSVVKGYFMQDTDMEEKNFDYSQMNFGLIDRTYDSDDEGTSSEKTQWERFTRHVEHLNKNNEDEHYKVFFLGRHGEGEHNVAERYYTSPMWDCYWSIREGNGTHNWTDAKLTPVGEQQARDAGKAWAHGLQVAKMPAPDAYYVSPLTRTIQTANFTFGELSLPADRQFRPVVKELIRESLSGHTCDRRGTRTHILDYAPRTWRVESGMSEEDEMWKPLVEETLPSKDIRARRALEDMYLDDGGVYISVTSHAGLIASILRVIGHRRYRLRTGHVLPVLVKAQLVIDRPSPTMQEEPRRPIQTCDTPTSSPPPNVRHWELP